MRDCKKKSTQKNPFLFLVKLQTEKGEPFGLSRVKTAIRLSGEKGRAARPMSEGARKKGWGGRQVGETERFADGSLCGRRRRGWRGRESKDGATQRTLGRVKESQLYCKGKWNVSKGSVNAHRVCYS